VVADRVRLAVAEVVSREPQVTRGLLKTEEVARLLSVDVEWVRANRVALGAIKLGDGPKARLRFPREAIDDYLAARRVGPRAPAETQRSRKPGRSRRATAVPPSLPATGPAVIDW
jgi:hypothetical protein